MPQKSPRLTARQVIKIIESKWFSLSRQNGSHIIFYNKKGVRITVPNHASKTIHQKILKNILRDVDIDEGSL
jgi:predicted RNA binding protein YcfA (HicA-like mRNA interferase family)